MKSIFDIKVSGFANVNSTLPQEVNLYSWLTSDKYRNKVEELRSLTDVGEQKRIKKTLPAITPSARFEYRDEAHFIEHSGFIAIDIDKQDNLHIGNWDDIKEQVSHFAFVAYVGLSVRGCGYWALIPIPKCNPKQHKQRFAALKKEFAQYKIIIDDNCGDVCRLRIYSWDPEPYFNEKAQVYTKILLPPPPKRNNNRPSWSDVRENVERLISEIEDRRIDITGNYKDEWFGLAASLANEFSESGRNYFHSISQFHPDYSPEETDKQYDNVLRKNYNEWHIGSLFAIAKNYGVCLKSEHPKERQKTSTAGSTTNDKPKSEQIESDPIKVSDNLIEEAKAPDIWGVMELENFFKSKDLPSEPVRLDHCSMITDVSLFVETHLSIVMAHNGNARYMPYYERLKLLRSIMN